MAKFTEEEKQFVVDNYYKLSTKEIANKLNRSEATVRNFAYRNNIQKNTFELSGKKIGRLTVINKSYIKRKQQFWLCKCDCGNTIDVRTSGLINKTRPTKSCGCIRLEKIYKGTKNISMGWYNSLKRNAAARDKEFNVSIEFLDKLLVKQEFKCALSDMPLYVSKLRTGKEYYIENSASLDRIDNNKSYTEDNVQFVHKHINYMKWTHNQDYFISLCKEVVKHHESCS
jgi:hypothetical protein